MKKALIFMLLMFTTYNINAQTDRQLLGLGIEIAEGIPMGLNVGEKAPNFIATDQFGNEIELYEELKKRRVVLNFYRGAWCPVCDKYMSKFQESMHLFHGQNVEVISITPETQAGIEEFINETELTGLIIADTDNSIMESYDVLFNVTEKYQKKIRTFLRTDIAKHNGKEEAKLPVPATYVIEQNGTITYVHFDANYKERAAVEDILKALE